MIWRSPHNPTAYDDDFEDQPGQSWFHQWVLGAVVPICVIVYGMSVVVTDRATYGNRTSIDLRGTDAVAYGFAAISVAVFLHFHYFWGNLYNQAWWAVLGKIVSAGGFIVAAVVLLIRVGVLGRCYNEDGMEDRPKPSPLSYSIQPRRGVAKLVVRGALVLSGILLFFFSVTRSVQSDSYWVEVQTGSLMSQSQWFGIKSKPHITNSQLEVRLVRLGFNHTPQWQFINETNRNFFGMVILRGCSPAPPIFQLRPVLQAYVDAASDDEIKQFVRTMQSGTDAQKSAAIEAAGERGLGSLNH